MMLSFNLGMKPKQKQADVFLFTLIKQNDKIKNLKNEWP